MRPSEDWVAVHRGQVRALHRHGVRTKKVAGDDRVLYLAPRWATAVLGWSTCSPWSHCACVKGAWKLHVDGTRHRRPSCNEWKLKPLQRRALRRAANDVEFRLAWLAALDIGAGDAFLKAQGL